MAVLKHVEKINAELVQQNNGENLSVIFLVETSYLYIQGTVIHEAIIRRRIHAINHHF